MKKVHPMQVSNNSVINLSSNDSLENSGQLSCRVCNVTPPFAEHEQELVYPCTCSVPIHKDCIISEFNSYNKVLKRPSADHHQQRYNCKKCSEVVRFTSKKELKCRSCPEIREFCKGHCCMCTTLSISAFLVVLMITCIIVVAKVNILQDKVISESAIIGISIGMGVIFLIILYFFVSEVLIKISYKVKLLQKRELIKKKNGRNNEISIVNYQ